MNIDKQIPNIKANIKYVYNPINEENEETLEKIRKRQSEIECKKLKCIE